MLLTINFNGDHQLGYDLITEDIPETMTVDAMNTFIEASTGIERAKIQLWFNGAPIRNLDSTIGSLGVKAGDIIVCQFSAPNHPTSQSSSSQPTSSSARQQAQSFGRPRVDPEQLRLQILGDPQYLTQFRRSDPDLAAKLDNPTAWRTALEALEQRRDATHAARDAELRALQADEMNPESQSKIAEMIRQERVEENFEAALENNPEIFGRVYMLYIPTEVNGRPVTAFVDSGAQTTIMSPETAEACGIMRLVDKRYAGIAVGVGTAKILGRVHSAGIRIGGMHLTCSFTVMEGKGVDLLLGLDMLKRHQACIDLAQDALVIGGHRIPFLGEAQIPKGLDRMPAELDEPLIEGPEGSQLGAVSGSVISPPRSAAQSAGAQPVGFQGAGRALGVAAAPVPQQSQGSSIQPSGSTQRQTPQAGAAPPSRHDASKVDHLVSMGFTRDQAIGALDATGGNLDYAAGLLFDS